MGGTSGKLVISHVEDKMKVDNNTEASHTSSGKACASQLVNGDANAVSDVPSIDEDVEETTAEAAGNAKQDSVCVDHTPEVAAHTQNPTVEPNGDVNTSVSPDIAELEKKKHKNPLVWIKRRLSKKSSTTKRPSVDETQTEKTEGTVLAASSPDETPVSAEKCQSIYAAGTSEPEVVETASSLVQEVLSSAIAIEEAQQIKLGPKDTSELKPILDVTEEHNVSVQEVVQGNESTHDESVGVDRAESTIHCETQPDASELTPNAVNGDHENEKTAVEDFPVVDTNNTNVHCDVALKMEEPEVKSPAFDDVMTAKLAGLELTNGHSHTEDVTVTTPSEVVVNGN
ncbi:hypothetical protein EG68_07003 [Paragonimus skrjabini miyazakii]|uniref:Uncharacterized protein n=1 Tax=Paragonimus skrjabini miyazakii TaxID=59628 RepID=A0A8S9YTF8_9TREM|nr:hypothetical protein EG68_07003 [Paragonimus skrjabini miyazakii]